VKALFPEDEPERLGGTAVSHPRYFAGGLGASFADEQRALKQDGVALASKVSAIKELAPQFLAGREK
jgi:hypothetical protein